MHKAHLSPTAGFTVDFLCVGAARAGTTWLYENLSRHPQICMSRPKELHFFAERTIFTASNADLGWDWYEARFAHRRTGQLRGEVSPSYLVDAGAPARIRAAFPACKIIMLFREPAEALHSLYLHGSCSYNLGATFEEFIENERFVQMYEYDRWVENYLRHFPREQMLFLPFGQLAAAPERALKTVCDFLGVPAIAPLPENRPVNRRRVCRSQLLRNALCEAKRALEHHPRLQRTCRRWGLEALGVWLAKRNRRDAGEEAMGAETRKKLAEHFRPHNERFAKLTGLDEF